MSGNYYTDETGAAEEASAAKARLMSRMRHRIQKYSSPTGKILLLAEVEIGASPKRAAIDGLFWLHARHYYVCLTDRELILIEVPYVLPDWSMLRPDVISAQLADFTAYDRKDELGWVTFAARFGEADSMRLNFEPKWRREAERLIQLLAQLRPDRG